MKLNSAKTCIFRITVFLIGVGVLCFYMRDILKSIFVYNVQINSVILSCTLFGVVFVYYRVISYGMEYGKMLYIDKLVREDLQKLKVLKPITLYISRNNKMISQSKLQTILASIEKKFEDYASIPKYISGILIFLGLLGTFWGLSHTIGNVAEIIDKLGIEQTDAAESFLRLKNSLKIPLSGMGIAFGCSLFGLSGSLLVGFLLLNQRKVSDDFMEKIEEWITKRTISFDAVDNYQEYHGKVFSMALLEKTIETIYAFQNQLKDIDLNRTNFFEMQKVLSSKIEELTKAVSSHQDLVKVLARNQIELQAITVTLSQKMTDTVWEDISNKIDSLNVSINNLMNDSIEGRKTIVQALGSDIRLVSKTLSSLVRE